MEGLNNNLFNQVSANESFYGDVKRLDNLKLNADEPENLKAVAKEFEALFLQMVLKSMRDANKAFESELTSSNAMNQYQDMYDKQLALNLSGNIGISEAMVRQLSPNVGTKIGSHSISMAMDEIEKIKDNYKNIKDSDDIRV